jgi:hypothetical protein
MLVKKQLTQRLNDLQSTHMTFEPQEDDVIEYEFFADEFREAIKVSEYDDTLKIISLRRFNNP